MAEKFAVDFFGHNRALRAKLWSYRRGFLSETVSSLKISNENRSEFISEVEYYSSQGFPNGARSRWFDDKLATYFLLRNHQNHLPEHYFHISGGKVLGLAGRPDGFRALESLLNEKKSLVVKDSWGSKGVGFRMVTREAYYITINGERIEPTLFRRVVCAWTDSIVTERLVNHPVIARLNPLSLNTLRVITAYTPSWDVSIVSAYLRVGTEQTGLVDNVSAGGIAVEVDPKTGLSGRSVIFPESGLTPTPIISHPSTQQRFDFEVPFWDEIVGEISIIARELKPTPWLGFDVAVTPDNFFITEINSHPVISRLQNLAPLRANQAVRELFPGQ